MTAYCGRCQRVVEVHQDVSCSICLKPIWELVANVPGPNSQPTRTTKAMYRSWREKPDDERGGRC